MILLDYAARVTQARHNNPKCGSLEWSTGAHTDKNAPSGARKSGFRGHSGIFTITDKRHWLYERKLYERIGLCEPRRHLQSNLSWTPSLARQMMVTTMIEGRPSWTLWSGCGAWPSGSMRRHSARMTLMRQSSR